nr:septal ring lytic transglycosylase RlpA family protein [Rhodoligotrophos appendicifer]
MAPKDFAQASTRLEGVASYYAHGKYTANGERFNPRGLTAAHRSLPFGTKVRVTHKKTGRSVIVRINDRGPFSKRRVIDVSRGAAEALGLIRAGVGRVYVEVVD